MREKPVQKGRHLFHFLQLLLHFHFLNVYLYGDEANNFIILSNKIIFNNGVKAFKIN